MKKNLLASLLAVLFLASCAPKDNTATTGTDSATIADTTKTDNVHTSQNSIDWKGLYRGVVPCADCEGIETTLILNGDETYLLQTKYLGKGDGKVIEKVGNFTWNAAGNTVILAKLENAPNQYFVGENKLIQLDMSGNKISGGLADKYILAKQ